MSHAPAPDLFSLARWRSRPFLGDWLWALAGLAGPTVLQLGFLVLAARLLTVTDFGNFLLLLSVIMVAVSFLGLGSSGVVLKMVSRQPERASDHFGQAVALIGISAIVLLPLVVGVGWLVTKGGLDLRIVLAVSAVELVAFRTIQTCSSLFVGFGKQGRSSLNLVSGPLARLLSALLAFAWPAAERLPVFVGLYCGLTLAAAALCLAYVVRMIGAPRLSLRSYRYWDGWTFALTDLNAILQSECDKLILGVFSAPAAVAVYTVALRLMDGAAMPPRALRMSVHARLFREGSGGSSGSLVLTLQLLPLIVGYGALTWAGFALAAPLAAAIFGRGFEPLSSILPILGLLPLLRATAEFGAEIFVTSDRAGLQVLLLSSSIPLRIIIGGLLVTGYGLDGAVVTTLSFAAATALILWLVAFAVVGRSTRSGRA